MAAMYFGLPTRWNGDVLHILFLVLRQVKGCMAIPMAATLQLIFSSTTSTALSV